MNRIIFLVLMFLMITSCISEQKIVEKKEVKKIEKVSLPAWVYELPPGDDFIIGIAGKSIYADQMKDATRQMAAVMHSRNRSSYTISKRAATDKEDYLSGGSAGFNLNVSSSPEETRRIYDSLVILDEVDYYGYFLTLYSDGKATLSDKHKKKYVANLPGWYENDGLKLEGDVILSYASTSSSDLISAWENAAEQARFEIAKYLEKNVQISLTNENEQIEKKYAIETRKKLSHLRINRSYITSQLYDNLRSYKVYLEITTR
jgi:hypothetical protein